MCNVKRLQAVSFILLTGASSMCSLRLSAVKNSVVQLYAISYDEMIGCDSNAEILIR